MDIIYEDEDFIGISKPAGILVHPIRSKVASNGASRTARNESDETVADWISERYPETRTVGDDPVSRPGIVHRLDKETSGVLVVAKNQPAFEYLKGLFQRHGVVKKYVALVHGKLEGSGVIDAPIGLKPGTVKRSVRARNMKMVKEAVTEYRPLEAFEKDGQFFTLLELAPRTGRTHQLRVHLASIHHPVVGDSLYGPKKTPLRVPRQFLHARSLEFTKPDGGRLRIEAELPADLQKIIDNLS